MNHLIFVRKAYISNFRPLVPGKSKVVECTAIPEHENIQFNTIWYYPGGATAYLGGATAYLVGVEIIRIKAWLSPIELGLGLSLAIWSKTWWQLKYKDNIKNKDESKNEENLKIENDLKHEDEHRNKLKWRQYE